MQKIFKTFLYIKKLIPTNILSANDKSLFAPLSPNVRFLFVRRDKKKNMIDNYGSRIYLYLLQVILENFSLSGPNTYIENETIAKYEIMDGAPVRGKYLIFAFSFSHCLVKIKDFFLQLKDIIV